jgi:hypothetical protein
MVIRQYPKYLYLIGSFLRNRKNAVNEKTRAAKTSLISHLAITVGQPRKPNLNFPKTVNFLGKLPDFVLSFGFIGFRVFSPKSWNFLETTTYDE